MDKKQMTPSMDNFDCFAKYAYSITTDKYLIQLTGGSIKFHDRAENRLLKTIKGFNYLYTGDVKPDETELMALENGKHFYIFSLNDFTQVKRVTLPRCYISVDACGAFSDDGEVLYIPVYKGNGDNGIEYCICQYSTDGYSLLRMDPISYEEYRAKWSW